MAGSRLIINAVASEAMRLASPLVIGPDDIDQAVDILSQVPGAPPDDCPTPARVPGRIGLGSQE